MSLGFRILVVGCGELGSRHLQAVAALPLVEEIVVVDPDPKAKKLGQRRLQDVSYPTADIHFRWLHSLAEVETDCDLCIVATQAKGRCQLIKDVRAMLGVRRFLIEKIVAPSTAEYEDLLQFAKQHALSVWVNCKSRAYPIHQYVKTKIRPEEPIVFHGMGGNHGLANNGVHTADLFAFYDGSDVIHPVATPMELTLHPSKRGNGLFDLSGTLLGKTDKGSTFVLSYAGDHSSSEQLTIAAKSYRCLIDHRLRFAIENDGEKDGPWRSIPFEGNLMVSQMTKTFAADILERGTCQLPMLEACWPAHRFILESLQPHFNRLLGRNLGYCPVT